MKKRTLSILTLVLSIALFVQFPARIKAEETQKDSKTGKVYINYVDMSGFEIHSPDVIEGEIGTPFTTDNLQREVILENHYPFWIPWGVEGAKTGEFKVEDQSVFFYFNRFGEDTDISIVSVIHKDEQGREIWKREEYRNVSGEKYKTRPADIPGFSYISSSTNTEGTYASSPITVTYTYKMNPIENGKGNVFVIYRSPQEGEVASALVPQANTVLLTGVIGTEYSAPYGKRIPLGLVGDLPDNITGVFTEDPIFVTIDYIGKNPKVSEMVTYHLDAAKVDDNIDVNDLSTLDNHPSLIQKDLIDPLLGGADWGLPYDSESLEITGSPEMKSKYKFKNILPGSAAPSGIRMYQEILLGKDSDLPIVYIYDKVKFNVTYTDGTGTESIFDDQIIKDIPEDSPTPAFSGSTKREGYTFKGWTPTVDATVTQDAVYTADWEKNKYTVTYESNGGTNTTPETVDYNTVFTKPENPTKEGNIFKGWFSDQTLTQGYDFSTPATKDITLYAKWEEEIIPSVDYTVTYKDGANGTVFSDEIITAKEGEATPSYSKEITRYGYSFDGWSPKVTETVTANATYSARWKKIDIFTVTYTDGIVDEEIFKDQVSNVYRNDPSPVYIGAEPTRESYLFKGWSPDYIGVVTENIIYTAQWEKLVEPVKEYVVSYTDGTNSELVFKNQSSKVKEGAVTPIFSGSTHRQGYSFEGWSPELSETVTANVIYVAQWKTVESPVLPVEPVEPTEPMEPTKPSTPSEPEKPILPVTGISSNHLDFLTIVLGGLVLSIRAVYNKKKQINK